MKKAQKNKIIFRVVIICLVTVFILSAVLLGISIWEKQRGKFLPEDEFDTSVEYNGVEYELNGDVESFLVMGLDKRGAAQPSDSYNNDYQADFLMLFVFDNAKKEYSAIHVNRDTMARINVLGVAGQKIDTVTKQIALSHSYGNGKEVSCRNTADAVSDLLFGMKVNHYLSLTMDAVPILNDSVGGVEVTVLDDFSGVDDTLVKGQSVVLKGEQALHYVRTRYGLEDSSNNTRMERQRQYIDALQKKLLQKIESDDQFIVDTSLALSDRLVSDRSVTQLQELADKISTYKFNGIRTIEGENTVGEKFVEFYADEDSVESAVIDLFYLPKR